MFIPVITISVLIFLLIILVIVEENFAQDIILHKGNLKRVLQQYGVMDKDFEYIRHMKNVYAPKKKEVQVKKDKRLILGRASDKISQASEQDGSAIKFDFNSSVMTQREIEEFALEIVKEFGYEDARIQLDNSWTVNIVLGKNDRL